MTAKQLLYRVIFMSQGKVYEVYAKQVLESNMFGFIEIEELIFGEHSSVVVDPSEEKLKSEFQSVKRSYIPMHAVIRIDEVTKEGTAKITELGKSSNVSPFPGTGLYPPAKEDCS